MEASCIGVQRGRRWACNWPFVYRAIIVISGSSVERVFWWYTRRSWVIGIVAGQRAYALMVSVVFLCYFASLGFLFDYAVFLYPETRERGLNHTINISGMRTSLCVRRVIVPTRCRKLSQCARWRCRFVSKTVWSTSSAIFTILGKYVRLSTVCARSWLYPTSLLPLWWRESRSLCCQIGCSGPWPADR